MDDIVYVPKARSNLISISKFCNSNKASIEFFPESFIVEDLRLRKELAQGTNNGGLYQLQSETLLKSQHLSLIGIKADSSTWHQRSSSQNSLPRCSSSDKNKCIACIYNKHNKLSYKYCNLILLLYMIWW